jgi:predicted DNA-binding transcriptional regulator YafY
MLLLQTRGKMTTQQLADETKVSRRTILRDIEALSIAGVPIYAEGGHQGGVTLDDAYRSTLVAMQEKEVRTLFVGDNSQLLREIGLGDAADSAMRKLSAVLPASHALSVQHFQQRILIDSAWWWRDGQHLPFWEKLQQAVHEDRCIEVIYEPSSNTSPRILEPYSLVAKSSVWYLVARQSGEFRTFRVSRIRDFRILGTRFHRSPDFDLPAFWREQQTHFAESVDDYRFTLRVHPDRMSFIKSLVPGRFLQSGPAGSDGWLCLQFRLESIDLAKMLVFGLGSQAEVVEPPELQVAVMDTARMIVNQPIFTHS